MILGSSIVGFSFEIKLQELLELKAIALFRERHIVRSKLVEGPERRTVESGVEFRFSPNKKVYLCLNYHRHSEPGQHKTLWAISEESEFALFCQADAGDWQCGDGHYWGVGSSDGGLIIGTTEERLAKFPLNDAEESANVPWHGFPVSPRDSKTFPPTQFVRKWVADGVISRPFGKKIMKGLI